MIRLSSYETLTSHSSNRIYLAWADPMSWPDWDDQVKSVTFTGQVTAGATGKLKPVSGPALRFEIETADLNREFTTASKLPGAKLHFKHLVEPSGSQTLVRVSIELSGTLAQLWLRLLQPGMLDSAEENVTGLLNRLSLP